MHDLLVTRDRLRAGPAHAERRDLLERMAMFSAAADERCQRLREQLDSVESLASMLRREANP